MNYTHHCQTRMNQRAIRSGLLDLVLALGEQTGEKIALSPRAIDEELKAVEQKKRLLLEAKRKGGIVAVVSNNAILTTYRLSNSACA